MLRRNTKRGSYLVEATIVVPIFIIAVLMLISIVPIISTVENISYIACDEIHLEDAKSAFRTNPIAYPSALEHRVVEENEKVNDFQIDFYRYKFTKNDIDDLISVNFTATFSEKNPLGLFSSVEFNGKVMSRAYTGTYYKGQSCSREELSQEKESKIVYIFPTWGRKYHGKSCTYVKSNCQLVYLSSTIKKKYGGCSLCKSKNAVIGSPVFCFTSSGEAYHYGNCKVVDKYYVEIEKDEAVKKGYSPCSKCGGE